jgi:hypothetical protein
VDVVVGRGWTWRAGHILGTDGLSVRKDLRITILAEIRLQDQATKRNFVIAVCYSLSTVFTQYHCPFILDVVYFCSHQ